MNCQDAAGRYPVHLAAENGHEDVAKILVVKGAQVEVEDKKGQKPLHLAARRGHAKMVTSIISGYLHSVTKNLHLRGILTLSKIKVCDKEVEPDKRRTKDNSFPYAR